MRQQVRETEIDIDKPLLSAARHGVEAVVSALLAHAGEYKDHSPHGAKPLVVAARQGQEEVVWGLVGGGGDC